MKTKFTGKIIAKSDCFLRGGVKRVESAPFQTRAEAKAWVKAMTDGQAHAISFTSVREVRA